MKKLLFCMILTAFFLCTGCWSGCGCGVDTTPNGDKVINPPQTESPSQPATVPDAGGDGPGNF